MFFRLYSRPLFCLLGAIGFPVIALFSMPLSAAPLEGISDALPKSIVSAKPWYSFKQLNEGAKIYRNNCASCHGNQAQGAPDWQSRDSLGRTQPPPLNGSGHAWHHRINELFETIKYGTVNRGGGMPAWGKVLSDQEIVSVMAWFQSRWPKQLYKNWVDRPHH
ncbi:cytochrome c [Motiliproteus sp. MSK22-1]|uniref:c-type cytochrome n=1 Tax=Motiliproteus sp. MSK22-1 TaxID=1897630 RepID=UPI0009F8684E|nr:cytochrome c [Motiliproteus sp. MSK22-1]